MIMPEVELSRRGMPLCNTVVLGCCRWWGRTPGPVTTVGFAARTTHEILDGVANAADRASFGVLPKPSTPTWSTSWPIRAVPFNNDGVSCPHG